MKRRLAFFAFTALIFTQPLPALAIDAIDLEVSRKGDTDMSCGELSQEAALMRDIVNTTEEIKDRSELQQHGVTAVGAVGSFLVGTMTGGIGLAAAGFLAEHEIDEKGDKADSVQDIAEQRRSLMMGIYNAKGCLGPIDHAMQDPPKMDILSTIADTAPAAGNEATVESAGYNQ